jgi:hypothetical protein
MMLKYCEWTFTEAVLPEIDTPLVVMFRESRVRSRDKRPRVDRGHLEQ